MGYHYVPQYYLKGFSTPSGKIWVYDKKDKRKYATQVKNVANENRFWPPETEKYLAKMEGQANPVIKKIRNRHPLTDKDKAILTGYMVTMMKRVPRGKERIKELAPSVMEEMSLKSAHKASEIIRLQPEKAPLVRKREAEIQEILKKLKFSKEPLEKVWHDNIPPNRSPAVVAAIRAMIWRFLVFDEQPALLTCDNPFFYFTGIGLDKPESELSFPISSHIVLWATWKRDLPQDYLVVKEQTVKEMNRRTAHNATRYVFHCGDEKWVLPFVLKRSWFLHLIR